MHRFFTEPKNVTIFPRDDTTPEMEPIGQIVIAGDDFHHLIHVLRIAHDERFEVCDGAGTDFICHIKEVLDDHLLAEIDIVNYSRGELPFKLTLFQGIPKGKKLDEIIQKGTELGYTSFVPFTAERTVNRPKNADFKKTIRRGRIAYEAAKQAGRGIIPSVEEPLADINAVAKMLAGYDLVLLAHVGEGNPGLHTVLQAFGKTPDNAAVIIGPEGGFTEIEVLTLQNAGARVVSLGTRVMRTETAGPALGAMLAYAFGLV